MSFEDNRNLLKEAVDHIGKNKVVDEPRLAARRQAKSYTLRPDIIVAINNEASKQHVSASHLVEEILTNHFDLENK